MSIKALQELTNGRDSIKAIISEFHFLGPIELSKLKIEKAIKSHDNCSQVIEHGLWKFCYHSEQGTVYLL